MPCTYTIDTDRDVVFLRAEGEFGDQELISLSRQIAADPRYHSEVRFFTDLTQVTNNQLSAESLSYIPTILKHSPKARCAIFFTWKLWDFGTFRMYEAYCSIKGFSVPRSFHCREEALAYLNEGMPPEKVIE
jgi:hypothetical protein